MFPVIVESTMKEQTALSHPLYSFPRARGESGDTASCLCADTARLVLSLSIGSGARAFVGRSIFTVGAKRFRYTDMVSRPRAHRQKHRHCWCQMLPLRGSIVHTRFHWYRRSGFHDTPLQSNVKCDVYIRKELYVMLCSQVARPRFKGFCLCSFTS